MKNATYLSSFLVCGFAFGQTPAPPSPNGVIVPDTAAISHHTFVPDEGTNNPELHGFVKHTLNGTNYYYKEHENISIVFVEAKH
jgi:hypothetical protein